MADIYLNIGGPTFDPLKEGATPDSEQEKFDPIKEGAIEDPKPQGPGIISRSLDWLNKPLYPLGEKILEYERPDIGYEIGDKNHISGAVEDAKSNEEFAQAHPTLSAIGQSIGIEGPGTIRSWGRGLEEGFAPEVSSMYTSPEGIGLIATGLGEGQLAKSAIEAAQAGDLVMGKQLWAAARMASASRRALSVPIVAQGAREVVNQPDIMGKVGGAAQMVLGGYGVASGLKPPSSVTIRPKTTIVPEPPVAPDNMLPGSTGPKEPGPGFSEGDFSEVPRPVLDGNVESHANAEETPDWANQPLRAKVGNGKAQISVNVRRAADELTTGYSNPLEAIMVREGLQNAFDAVKGNPGHEGKTHISINKDVINGDKIMIADNGRGMTPDQLYTVYTNLHESSKIDQEDASGGKGVGKAPYMLGGKYFRVITVTEVNGQKIQSSFEGTPEQLLQPFDVHTEVVPQDTPTGTRFETTLKEGQDRFNAYNMLDKILEHSRDLPVKVQGNAGFTKFENKEFKSFANDKLVTSQTMPGNNPTDIYIPDDAKYREGQYLTAHYLNNGMYQFSKDIWLNENAKGIPDKVLVNIKPKAKEGSTEYPFPVQRETVKDEISKAIEETIIDHVVNPLKNRVKEDLHKLWNGMQSIPVGGDRETVLFDSGNKLAPSEMDKFKNSELIKKILDHYDQVIERALNRTGREGWQNRVKRVGITLDPDLYGIHIPHPIDPKGSSAILINPFNQDGIGQVVTMLHEMAHVGNEEGKFVPLKEEDVDDPRVGKYLQTYLKEVINHGGSDQGHNMGFVHRLGEIYGAYGTKNGVAAADILDNIIGRHSSEFQELLHLYTESRGREASKEDIISGTGTKSAATGANAGNNGSNQSPNAGRVLKGPSTLREVRELPRAAQLTFHTLAAPFRQARPLIGTVNWFKAYAAMYKAFGSEAAFDAIMQNLESMPHVQDGMIPKMGVRFSELKGDLTKREETMRATMLERVPLGIGKFIRGTNRGFAAYLNSIRAYAAHDLVDDIGVLYGSVNNIPPNVLTEMGDFVNDATGRSSLKLGLHIAGQEKQPAEMNVEKFNKYFSEIFLSPRQTASTLRMLNPGTYIMLPNELRNKYLMSLMRLGAAWLTMAYLGKQAGAKITTTMTNSDLGKWRLHHGIRIDTSGGIASPIVAASKLISGETTSSNTGKTTELGKGFHALTRKDVVENFATARLEPVTRFAYDLMTTSNYKPFGLGDETAKMFVPLVVKDIHTIMKTDPSLFPWLAGSMFMGAQQYEQGEQKPDFVPRDKDIVLRGGPIHPLNRAGNQFIKTLRKTF